jgi:hypothetical protein
MGRQERSRAVPSGDQDPAGIVDLDERNQRVLHTRIPESLERNIKRRARNLGMSVSTVVRHILLNTFGLVEDIVNDSASIALSITGREAVPPGARASARGSSVDDGAPATSDILGWHEAILNLSAVCDRCNAVVRPGTWAALGVREQPGPRAIICGSCFGGLVARAGDRRRRKP